MKYLRSLGARPQMTAFFLKTATYAPHISARLTQISHEEFILVARWQDINIISFEYYIKI